MVTSMYAIHFELDEAKKKQRGEDFFQKNLPGFLEAMSKRLEKNGSKGILAGDKYSIADFYLGSYLTIYTYNDKFESNAVFREIVEKFPEIKKFADRYQEELKEHLEKRPKYAM